MTAKMTWQQKRDREIEDEANLAEWRRENGLCARCGTPISSRFPMHECKVKGHPTTDGLGTILSR